MLHYTDCGLSNIWLKNGFKTIKTPYGKATAIDDVQGLHRAIALRLVRGNSPLTGAQFRFLRKELALSQEVLGQLLGYSDGQQIAKWEKGARLPRLQDGVMRALYLESINEKNAPFRTILNQLQEMDADHQNAKLIFSETIKKGWVARAA